MRSISMYSARVHAILCSRFHRSTLNKTSVDVAPDAQFAAIIYDVRHCQIKEASVLWSHHVNKGVAWRKR